MNRQQPIKLIIIAMSLILTTGLHTAKAQWTNITNYPDGNAYSVSSFVIGNKAYCGGGNISKKSFYEYDPATDMWSWLGDIEGGVNRASAIRFAIGEKGYIGCGSDFGQGNNNNLYEFDPKKKEWTKKADFPGGFRHSGFYTAAGGKGYVICGNDNNDNVDEVWEYNPKTDKWTQKAPFPGGNTYWPTGFVIDGKIYVGTGSADGSGLKNFYEYDPAKDKWTKKKPFPGDVRVAAVGFAMGTRGYIGGGTATSFDNSYRDFFEYSPAVDEWYPTSFFFPINNTAWSAAFVIGNEVFMGTGASATTSGISQTDLFYKMVLNNATGVKHLNSNEELEFQAFPNPANEVLKVRYEVPTFGFTSLVITSLTGQIIEIYDQGQQDEGVHYFQLPVGNIKSGVYNLTIRTENSHMTKKITILH